MYLSLIVRQGTSLLDALPWTLFMAVAASVALAGALIGDRGTARKMMVFAAVLFGILGGLAILTIGVGFLLTAILAAVAAGRVPGDKPHRSRS